MINANELRIGNWVDCLLLGKYQLKSGDIEKEKAQELYKPIPLTPEILKKCGAIELPKWNEFGNSMIIVNSETGIAYTETGLICIAIVNNKEGELIQRAGSFLDHIKHLHQLQNLYFALTGQEIIYKP